MDGHPGGLEHSRYLIELSFLPPGSRWLDMGAGDGAAVRLLREQGHEAIGIDLDPRGAEVEGGDFLHAPYQDGSFDGIISQCALYVSGDVPGALKEAGRLLRAGGKLVFSDVSEDVTALLGHARAAGFAIRHLEDLSDQWREYYLETLWREGDCPVPTGSKLAYVLFVCERM